MPGAKKPPAGRKKKKEIEKKIDKRRRYYLVLDTETANTYRDERGGLVSKDALFYDLGAQVVDKSGNVYERLSFINRDIYYGERDLMQSAYYADKMGMYDVQIREGSRTVASLYEIRKAIADVIAEYGITAVMAHNAKFDYDALNATQRYVTKSKYRYFLPKGVEWHDTVRMARSTIAKQKTYRRFCQENGYLTKGKQPQCTAEVLYRYISGNDNFIESHTGLEDVEIETRIFAHCMRQHKPMKKKLFKD